VEACPALLAISYQVLPELRQVVVAWEVRALVAGVGVLAAYVLLRLRSRPARICSSRNAALRLLVGGIVAWGVWLAVDLVRGESFLAELWAAMPPVHENAVKGLVLVGGGWVAWSIAVSELLRRAVVARQQRHAAPGTSPAEAVD
jgi:hypothetical protein